MLRRVRGILAIAIGWSLVFAVAQSPLSAWLFRIVSKDRHPELWPIVLRALFIWMATGFVSGAVFAAILIRLAQGSRIEQFSLRRFALWGIAAGALAPLLAVPLLAASGILRGSGIMLIALSGVGAVLGCATAGATLWIARRSPGAELLAERVPLREVT